MNKVEIPLNKSKIIILILGSCAFVFLGIFFFRNPDDFVSPVMRSPDLIRIAGIASILFFGAAAIFGCKKMFDTQIGLTIDDNGIFDNTNLSSVGLIKWGDIKKIETREVASTRFLLLYIKNPQEYLDRVSSFKRKLLQANDKMYGTPLSITFSTISYSFDDLEKLIKEKLAEYQNQMPNR